MIYQHTARLYRACRSACVGRSSVARGDTSTCSASAAMLSGGTLGCPGSTPARQYHTSRYEDTHRPRNKCNSGTNNTDPATKR
eukprot:2570777-Rhodomonas_salina.3